MLWGLALVLETAIAIAFNPERTERRIFVDIHAGVDFIGPLMSALLRWLCFGRNQIRKNIDTISYLGWLDRTVVDMLRP